VKHTRKTLVAVGLFGLAPLALSPMVGCDQNGVEDASSPDGARMPDASRTPDATRTPDTTRPADTTRDPAPPAGVEDPEEQLDDPTTGG
jgi:hypothetical protein